MSATSRLPRANSSAFCGRAGRPMFCMWTDGRKLNAMHGRHSAVSGDHFLSPEEMTAVFREAGFGRIETDEGVDHFYFCARREG